MEVARRARNAKGAIGTNRIAYPDRSGVFLHLPLLLRADLNGPRHLGQGQTYIEDCEVSCHPIEVQYTAEDDEVTRFAARAI
jgi:hypothetical protein